MDAALGQQWVEVQFKPNTTLATAKHVTTTCSHVPRCTPEPVRPTPPGTRRGRVRRYNSTHATDADLAKLQECLQRFPSVQGVTDQDDTG